MRNIKQITYKPNESVIQLLEGLLEKARSGYIYSLAAVCEDRDGSITYARSIDVRNVLRIVGGLEMFKLQLIDAFVEVTSNE